MDTKAIIMLVLLALASFGFGWFFKPAEVIDRTNYQQETLDSLTSVIRNRHATAQSLRDSLKNTSEAFKQYIDEHQGEVATLTTIRGRLRTQLDSLAGVNRRLSAVALLDTLGGQVFKDTTLVFTRTFGDSLFKVTSNVEFLADSISNRLQLETLRQVRLDVALLVSEDQRTVESLVTSPDFDSLRVSAQTQIELPKKRLHWTIILATGALLGMAADKIL